MKMPTTIDRDEVQRLVEQDQAQLVEVLERPEYDWAHLPNAIHLPLKHLDAASAAAALDPDRPVIVYCHDLQCDLSPRAAWVLEHLGYGPIYDYAVGKIDWLSFNLPFTGTADLVGAHLDPDPATCRIDEPVSKVAAHYRDQQGRCIVVNDQGVVMGGVMLDKIHAAEEPERTTVAQLTRFGVGTVRPSEEVDALIPRMERAGISSIVVTRSDGNLLGRFHLP
jgi:rhodanese-related sulfurtransferase